MGNRRFTHISISDDEDEGAKPPLSSSYAEAEQPKKKKMKLEEVPEDAKPIGEVIGVSGKGREKRNHFQAFEYDGDRFELEDPVLLSPEDYITRARDGSMWVTGQWFYRPEEAEKRRGGSWEARDTRELFYSFHRDEVPAESVKHKCVVHFVPLNKQLPLRTQHPGFIVQRVYDTVEKKLWKLTDRDYEDTKQHEIDLLVEKTRVRLGELPDIETEDASTDQEDQLNKRMLRRKNMSLLDVSREDDGVSRSDQHLKAETPGSCPSNASEFYSILANFNALTGDTHRDKWLEKLLQGIQFVCSSKENVKTSDKAKGGSFGIGHDPSGNNQSETSDGSQEKSMKGDRTFWWPDAAVPAITALEKASHGALSFDYQKYNQKMRQMLFNLKNNGLLARRLLNGELEPSKILNMSPNELKDGLMAEETASKEPEESEHMQMTDARCSRCMEKKVGLTDIIQAGLRERYQLECIACGNTWYASTDEASTLSLDGPSAVTSVGTAPWATAKFEDVKKTLISHPESEKSSTDTFKKTTAAYVPVLDTQKSFSKKTKTLDTQKSFSKKTKTLDTQKSFSRTKTEAASESISIDVE
ncbi:hypothetical protein HHK36_028959 [Tetracentron sinense]|uniref:Uncharacterized protein n=1 Tax=Tetracentron sinense TaxID=13715 RepID=A0A834YCD9_TETSI|nr:hypothetical protein HHK36_028959 [Tetracentron sinense]